jgi:PleD family two-component response regulator
MGSNAVCTTSEVGVRTLEQRDVVIADADAFRRSLIGEILTTRGFVVHEAASGGAALDTAIRIIPALIIADFALPGLDAISLRSRMREKTELARIPFIMIVDRKSAEIASRAYSLGISVILQRPILIAEYIGLVENLVEEGSRNGR